MKHFPFLIFAVIIVAIFSSMHASLSEPTHLNIFYSDSIGLKRVFSIPFGDIEKVSFKNRDDDSFNAIRLLRRSRINDNDTIPADTIPDIPLPNDSIPGDSIPTDTIVAPDTISPNDSIPTDSLSNDSTAVDSRLSRIVRAIKNRRNSSIFKAELEKTINMDSVSRYQFGTNVPTIRIYTDSVVDEISSKTDYLSGLLEMEGFGAYDDVAPTEVGIRGRGNTSWVMPKKPYRLKFSKKLSLCSLAKAKSFVLIANYIDATHLRNALALRLSQLLEMPFANHSIPVNVELNGIPKGAYMLSEKQAIGKGSVDIDQTTGILWEIDQNFDEEYKFESSRYALPVMLADPDPHEILPDSISPDEWFETWKADFERMETSVKYAYPQETIDLDQLADYLIVNLVTGNSEVDWPKSVKLYKEAPDSLYKFGPVWDFDWAFGYDLPPTRKLFVTFDKNLKGCFFFRDIVKTTKFMTIFRQRWEYVRSEIIPEWLDYIDEYAAIIRISALQDGEIWPEETYCSADFDNQVKKIKEWIQQRLDLIDSDSRFMLY